MRSDRRFLYLETFPMSEEWPAEAIARFLRCPLTGQSLSWADPQLVRALNRRIESHELIDRSGTVVKEPFDAALVDASRRWVYPCWGGLPTLLPDEAIELVESPGA